MKLNFILNNLLNENNFQDLYHFTDVKSLLKIIEDNQLGEDSAEVSLTRNKNLNKHSIGKHKTVKIVIDGNKLRHNYKLRPYHWGSDTFWKSSGSDPAKFNDEFEEQTEKPIKNLIKYVKEITVPEVDLWDYLDEDNWEYLGPVCRYFNRDPETISFNDIETFLLKSGFKINIK